MANRNVTARPMTPAEIELMRARLKHDVKIEFWFDLQQAKKLRVLVNNEISEICNASWCDTDTSDELELLKRLHEKLDSGIKFTEDE